MPSLSLAEGRHRLKIEKSPWRVNTETVFPLTIFVRVSESASHECAPLRQPTMDSLRQKPDFQVLPEELPESFCILSAWDTEERNDSPEEITSLDIEMAERLDDLGLPRVRLAIVLPDGAGTQPGWAVACPLARGLEVGREFRTKTIYFVDDGELSEVCCEKGTKTSLGEFSKRVRDPRHCRLFTIFLGSPSPRGRLFPDERFGIITRVTRYFESFTINEAEGFFRQEAEDTLLISAATDQPSKVLQLAMELLEYTGQQGVGVAYNDIYQRVTRWTDEKFLLHVWEIDSNR
jgi:hypothetical protein